jgi:Protein kinase domain/CHAT domain
MANLDVHTGAGSPKRLGPYRLLRPIGQTSLATIYLGETVGGHLAVLKVLSPELADDPEQSGRFAREVAAVRRVSGLYTPAILDADPDGPEPWLATQYIPGPSLREAMAERGPLTVPSLAALGAGLAEALAAIHAAGIVHRDLRPSNVILASDGPRIIDFGIARLTDAPEFTRPGMFLGTPDYASPEQVDGEVVGPEGDVFSLGGVLTFAATGHEPFPGDAAVEQLYRVRTGEPDLRGLPEIMLPLVTSCLAKDPARRPTTVALVKGFRTLGTRELGGDGTGPRSRPVDIADRGATGAAPVVAAPVAPVAAAAMAPAPPSPGVADGGQYQGAPSEPSESAAPWDYDQPLRYDDGDDRRRDDNADGYDYFAPPEADGAPPGPDDLPVPEADADLSDGSGRGGNGTRGWWRRRRGDKDDDVWPDAGGADHDGVSDEDYWASVTAERPLAAPRQAPPSQTLPSEAFPGEPLPSQAPPSQAPLSLLPPGRLPQQSQVGPEPAAAAWADDGHQDWSPGYAESPSYAESLSAGGLGGESAAELPAARFLTGVLPERAPSGARISLLVLVTLDAIAGAATGTKAFPATPEGTTVTITVSAPGLVPLGDLDQDLAVPFATDSESVRFGFLAGQAGQHTVAIRAFAAGTCLGELSLQISVESGAILEEGRPQSAPMSGLAAEAGEVTLQVSRTAGGGYSFQLLSAARYPVVLVDWLAGDPASVAGKIVAELQMMAAGQSPYATAAHARNRLRALGTELWADVVPEAIRRQFWAQRDRIRQFTIATDMDSVPWELVYPVDLENEDGFLVEQFPVVRRAYGQGQAPTLRLDSGAGFIVPPGGPAGALDEVNAVRGILPASVADRGVEAGLSQVLGLFDAMPSVLHFAGHHASADEAGPLIGLEGGPLRPEDLAYARQKRAFAGVSPLVFLNGCRTAGEIAGFSQMNGWADKFMGAGAGAFVGSLWSVRSGSAKVFAEEFYRQLVTWKQPLGTASLRARQAVAADGGDPTWLAYTVYGNASAAVGP